MFKERFKRTLLSCPYRCALSWLLRHEATRSILFSPGWDVSPLRRHPQTLGSLRNPRRQRQRERRETKGLMSRTIAVHVRYNSLYISLPSSTKQQREMTNSALSEERELRRLIF